MELIIEVGMQKSGNPALRSGAIKRVEASSSAGQMTRVGTYLKTAYLSIILILAAAISWHLVAGNTGAWVWIVVASIVALILGLVISFKPAAAPVLSTPYAIAEGALLGVISGLYATQFDGIVVQAITITLGIFIAVYLGYAAGILRATPKFVKVIIFAMAGILVYYLLSFIFSLFGLVVPSSFALSGWGIAIGVFIVIVAALSLVLDFDFIDRASEQGAPKAMEWYGAFGLLVGLVWLYLEILRLLAQIAARSQR
jgi:uncharacterized YccA/Bax inhibitor family protein